MSARSLATSWSPPGRRRDGSGPTTAAPVHTRHWRSPDRIGVPAGWDGTGRRRTHRTSLPYKQAGGTEVSQTRGAAAPTSGTQDHVMLDQEALDQAMRRRRVSRARTGRRRRRANAPSCSSASCATPTRWPRSGTTRPARRRATTPTVPKAARSSSAASARSSTWPRRSASRCSTSPRMAARTTPARCATSPVSASPSRWCRAASSTGSSTAASPARCGWSRASTEAEVMGHAGRRPTRTPAAHAGVSLVLGAGNVASLGPRDVLTKLFAEGKVVVLKANPSTTTWCPTGTGRCRR